MKTYEQFYKDVPDIALKQRWRLGQAFFNHLLDVKPELAERIRATENDPFHASAASDPRYQRAVEFVKSHWNVSWIGDAS